MMRPFYVLGVNLGLHILEPESVAQAWHKLKKPELSLQGLAAWLAYGLLVCARRMGLLGRLQAAFEATMQRKAAVRQAPAVPVYTPDDLNRALLRVYDPPEIVVDPERPPTINVLVPAFDFRSMSAGFFGVFQVARFLRTTGMRVRLVMYDEFEVDIPQFRAKFRDYPGLENLFDEVEADYVGDRKTPLRVSPQDNCLATVWYSAHLAQRIMDRIGGRPFFYLIQDYETNFHPGGSLFALAEQTYAMDYHALFSTESLQKFFIAHDIGGIRSRGLSSIHFNNACSAQLPSEDSFIKLNANKKKKNLVFYSRPPVYRNMFELTALTLATAYRRGVFSPEEWNCIGMGLGDAVIDLGGEARSVSLPRMTLREYMEQVPQFDICLTLMASPHPSLIPMDLGGSGALVVTNTFANKDAEYLQQLCGNIIPAAPDLDSLVAALGQAVKRVDDLGARYDNARLMRYPREWSESLGRAHTEFFIRGL